MRNFETVSKRIQPRALSIARPACILPLQYNYMPDVCIAWSIDICYYTLALLFRFLGFDSMSTFMSSFPAIKPTAHCIVQLYWLISVDLVSRARLFETDTYTNLSVTE